jgi:NADH-quinone oxidoreductase subunit N
MKYFLIGAFATGILFYGIVLLYGASHPVGQWGGVLPTQGTPRSTFDLPELCRHLDAAMTKASGDVRRVPNHALLLAAVGLIIVGFGFKVASVPFHAWAPDVYEGAPTPVTAFMATAVKAAAFAALVRILITGLRPFFGQWCAVFVWLAVLTMFLGNLVALTQTNMKRMLAYSSIAHAGYLLIGICALDATSGSPVAAVLYYLLAYAFMNMGTFAIISFLETQEGRGLSLDEYSGLAGKHPYLCAAMSVFMLSLGGIPLTGGFMGKLFVFRAAIHADRTFLAVLGILNSLISLFYYLRVMIRMYMDKPAPVDEGERPPMPSVALAAAIAICVAGTLWLGFGPPVGLGIADLWNWAVLSQQSLAP